MPTRVKEIQKVSDNGLNFIAKEEGCVLRPYKDSRGVWTIGIGCTYYPGGKKVKPTDPKMTMAEALALFKVTIRTYEKCVWSTTPDKLNQNQFDALVSICYNIGVNGFKGSTLLRRVNNNINDPKI